MLRRSAPSILASLTLLLLLLLHAVPAAPAPHTHLTPDGLETAACTCRPAAGGERSDPSRSPDGWVQEEPRASRHLGGVPFPLVPDWVGTRTRAVGGLAWGDIDGDGDQDLVVGTYWANQFPPLADYYNFAYLNTGGMLESDPSWISSDQMHTTEVRVGLINDDLYPDFFFANGGQSLQPSQVFYGRDGLLPVAAGWFSNDNTWTIGCALADFDRDGDTDVATANQGNTVVPYRPTYLFRNLGSGLETSPSWQSSQVGITNQVDWGDMDGDGWLDLAVSGWVNWQTGVFRNTGSSLTPDFVWTTGHPERTDKGIGWALANGDPRPDLAVGGNGGPDWLFHNEGTALGAAPAWASAEPYHGCQDLAWADVDRDGDPDLATVNFGNGHVRIYLNDAGVLSTLADWQYDDASSATALRIGDLNGDGWPDLATGVANGPVKLFLNTGAPLGIAATPPTPASLGRPGVLSLRASPNPPAGRVELVAEAADPFVLERWSIFDLAGRLVARLAPAVAGPRRVHAARWDPGRLDPGRRDPARTGPLPAGTYFARAEGTDASGRPLAAAVKVVLLGP